MSFRTTYILFGLLGSLILVFGLALWLAPYNRVDSAYVLPSAQDEKTRVKSDDIVKVEVKRNDSDVPLVFRREPQDKGQDKDKKKEREFQLETPSGYRINSSPVLTLINQVLDAKSEEGDLTSNLKDWGLDKPRGQISLTTDSGKTLTVYLGEVRNNRLYVTSSDKPDTPMVLKKSALDAAFNQLSDFRARDLITARTDQIHWLKLEKPAKDKTERIVLSSADNQWRYDEPKYGAANLDSASEPDAKGPSGVSAVLSALTGLRVEGKTTELPVGKDKKDKPEKPKDKEKELGFWKNDVKTEELKEYGLDSDANASLVLEVKKEAADKEGQKVLIGKETADKSDLYFARIWPERNVLTVSKKSLEIFQQFLANPEAVRDRDLVKLTDKPDVIRIKYPDGESIELVRTAGLMPPNPHGFPGAGAGETWKLYRGKDKKGMNTDAEAVKLLIDALVSNKRQVKEFPSNPDDDALGLKDPKNLSVSLWVKGVKEPEKKKEDEKKDKKVEKKEDKKDEKKTDEDRPELKSETPDVELSFGRVDTKKLVAVKRRTGKDLAQVDVFKVFDSVLETANRGTLAYLDRTLPSFFPGNVKVVTKVTQEADGKTTVAERSKPDSEDWVLKQPAEWAGRKADKGEVSGLFFLLNRLAISRWESLKPSDADLGRLGLKTPSVKVTLGLAIDKKDSDVSLTVGGTDGKGGFYAKKSDFDPVFVLNKSDVDRLKELLLSMTVFELETDKVKAIKLTGWPRRGKPDVLVLTRENATTWKGKDLPAEVKVHSDQVEKLLESLVRLKAKKFFFKTAKKEEHGLDPAKGALEVELTVEEKGEKDKETKTDKITLTIGAAEADGVYAVSNKHPDDVFVIGKADAEFLEKVKKDSELLAK